MVVAIYNSNRSSQFEQIRVHKYESDGKLRIESVTSSYAHEIGGVFNTIEEVEAYLQQRDRTFGYTLKVRI